MKKFRKMKKNNKGFSLVELIVVIAIMAVLVGVLGSAILGYIEDANYESDRTALKSVETAIEAYIASEAVYTLDDVDTLDDLLAKDDKQEIFSATREILIKEGENIKFNNQSDAFEGIEAKDITVIITQGNLYMEVVSKEKGFDNYKSGVKVEAESNEEDPTDAE